MTDQEIEKLREKLGSDYSVKRQNGAITVELVDIWDGVEFAEWVSDVKVDRYGKEIAKGQIYRIVDWFKREVIYIDKDELGWQSKHFKPSTESAYVEQLKAKAKELYGEIKDGDRFVFTWSGHEDERNIHLEGKHEFCYYKEADVLTLHGFTLYNQGKWAKKVDEPIRVYISSLRYLREPIEYMGELIPSDTIDCTVHFTIEGSSPKIILKDDFRQLLSKCLEDYLNKIP